VYLIKKETL